MKLATVLAALAISVSGFSVQTFAAQPSATVKGEVLEVKDVDMYTYLRLKTQDGETWAAVTKTPVKKGAEVTIENTVVMTNFESKALKKKFDKIVFGSIANPNAKSAAPHGEVPSTSAPVAKLAKATGPGAKTVAEVIAGTAALKDKAVLLRGQVVKFNSGIMGKNWVHLQDGSGSAANGTNDILVTTQAKAAVGDIVTAKGTVRTDVNFGAGYSYAVIIEAAELKK